MKFLLEEYVLVQNYLNREYNPYLGLVKYRDNQLYWKNSPFGLQLLQASPVEYTLTIDKLIGNKYQYNRKQIESTKEPVVVVYENGKYFIVNGEATVIFNAMTGTKDISALVYSGKEINQEIKNYHYNDIRDNENYIWYDERQNRIVVHFDNYEYYDNDYDEYFVDEFNEHYSLDKFLPIIEQVLGKVIVTPQNIARILVDNQEKFLDYFRWNY